MGELKDVDYYDNMFAESELYARPWQEAPWRLIWQEIILRLDSAEDIMDCGCGSGQFATMLRDTFVLEGDYWGVDFSEVALRHACKRLPDWADRFQHWDLRNGVPQTPVNTYIFCEVLEHIKNDHLLLATVPIGRRIILTVPNYDDPAHVRIIANNIEAARRYGHFIDIQAAVQFSKRIPPDARQVTLIDGIRK